MDGDGTSTRRPDRAAGFRRIPSVHQLVERLAGETRVANVPRSMLVDAARTVLADERSRLAAGVGGAGVDPVGVLAERVAAAVEAEMRDVLAPAINATGVIIHTGLGRAPLAAEAARAVAEVAGGYAPIELDLASGERGRRTSLVRDALCRLTGAESATVVNNNAAALMLVLSTLASGRSVVVSRGELIEIGGSFRLPDVMAAGGVILREVGTTNRTRLDDYERAVDDTTAVLMKVHPSNYRIEGFTASVPVEDLAALGHRLGLPVVHDIGSGALRGLDRLGVLPGEPVASACIEGGADVVLFSGDKLLGGPQAGIIVGRRALIERIDRHPMMRAMRIDKIRLAALAATLELHRDPDRAVRDVPVLAMMAVTADALKTRAHALATHLHGVDGITSVEVRETTAEVGGGSLPGRTLPSVAIALRTTRPEGDMAARLRTGTPPVVPRVRESGVWLDLRTVRPDQDDPLARAVITAARGHEG